MSAMDGYSTKKLYAPLRDAGENMQTDNIQYFSR